MASTSAMTEIIKVSALDKCLSLFGRNNSAKPVTKGKKTNIGRILSNLYVLHLEFRRAQFLLDLCCFLTAQFQQGIIVEYDLALTINNSQSLGATVAGVNCCKREGNIGNMLADTRGLK